MASGIASFMFGVYSHSCEQYVSSKEVMSDEQ